jgi:hypothetical protein
MHVPNARAHVFKASYVRAIMRMQDVWVGSVVNTCKSCGHASTVQLQYFKLAGSEAWISKVRMTLLME